MRVNARTAEGMMRANVSTSASGLKGNSRPVITTTKKFTRNIGRKHSLRVRPQKARWRVHSVRTRPNALAAFAPPRATSRKSHIGGEIRLKVL